MVEIEIQKDIKEYTPLVSRWFTTFVVAICIIIKISDQSIDIGHVMFGTISLFIVSEIYSKIPSQLKMINILESYVEFVYVKAPSTKLIVSLVRDGNIELRDRRLPVP